MRRILKVLTPENVHVEYELAGLGSRFIAFFIDCLIQFVIFSIAFIAMYLVGVDFGYLIWELGVLEFILFCYTVILFFHLMYFIFLETILKGQTLGKRCMKLRVIKGTGEPINIVDAILRGFLRLVISLPLVYIVDVILVVTSKKYQRIGDFAANTIVIKIKRQKQLVQLENLVDFKEEDHLTPNIYPVNSYEYNVLKEFLARKHDLGERREVFVHNLKIYFMKKFNMEKPHEKPYQFFEEIIKVNNK
ncbi:RDD family protein [Herbivorax sp. ANBcel31]|uniref:RDD family protein n=1 Tax=Herbivorax sp. ANBcel31 TaxID=3069754 RepID=UPI0027B3AC5B|nr:RDD family protein [Herbivorax sp. ANBcel31]MDQ2086207.1 RDD family protein [Herbivorax sp. ANBcel31]